MNTESLMRTLQLVVFLSVLNTLATMAMIGQAFSGDVVKTFAKAPDQGALTSDRSPSIISVEGVVLDR